MCFIDRYGRYIEKEIIQTKIKDMRNGFNFVHKSMIIVFVGLFRFIFDICFEYKKCYADHPKIGIVLLIHALIWSYSYLGWIYCDKRMNQIYLLFLLCMIIHWVTNNNRCVVTESTNCICDFDIKRRYENDSDDYYLLCVLAIFRIIGISIAFSRVMR